MSGAITTQGSRVFLQSFFGKNTEAIPSQFWIALISSSVPFISSTGDDIDEIDNTLYPSYERAQYPNTSVNWQISGYDTIFNAQSIEFPIAGEDWGEIGYYGVCTTKNGGDLLAFGELSTSQDVIQGDQVQIDIGGISFTIYNPAYEGS